MYICKGWEYGNNQIFPKAAQKVKRNKIAILYKCIKNLEFYKMYIET